MRTICYNIGNIGYDDDRGRQRTCSEINRYGRSRSCISCGNYAYADLLELIPWRRTFLVIGRAVLVIGIYVLVVAGLKLWGGVKKEKANAVELDLNVSAVLTRDG